MRLLWVELDCFRNLERQKVSTHPRFNLVLGANGQGKTNFLEAIGYLGTLKSFRSASRTDMIRQGRSACRVSGEAQTGKLKHSLAFTLSPRGRVQCLDDRKLSSPTRYLEALGVVSFIPEDVSLVSGAPSRRRRIVDRAVFDVAPAYAEEYRRYLRVLRQRNTLLRRRSFSEGEKESWDSEMASAGAAIMHRRCGLLASVNQRLGDLGERLGLGGGLRLRYEPSFTAGDGRPSTAELASAERQALAQALREELARVRAREAAVGHSLAGPHRDDILFVLGQEEAGSDLGRFGSQGQKRTAVLALKLALAEVVREARGSWPVILLDDVASELDASRRQALGSLVREMEAQFFITTTGDDYMFLPAEEGRIWRVEAGRLEEVGKERVNPESGSQDPE